LTLFKPILYDQLFELNEDMRIVFNDAGHILGSAITEIWVKEGDKEAKVVFSGDLGMMNRPILRDPTIIKKADYVIMETTYGNRNHPENSTSIQELLEIILKTAKRGGNVVIPSFAVGRTQELVYELNKFYEEHDEYKPVLDKVMVYVDSPMATTATEVFRKNAQVFDEETKAYILRGDNPLDFKNLKFTRTSQESQGLNFNKEPKIIISASGMCEAGRIRHHLKHNLWDARNSIIFVGYQAEGTLGKALVEGASEVTMFGEVITVNAEIYNLGGFSGHADQNSLFAWLAGFQQKPKQVFLVHGEADSKRDFGQLIHDKLGYEPVVIQGNSEFELDMNTAQVVNYEEAMRQGAQDEEIRKVRMSIADIHNNIENILYHTDLAINDEISEAKLMQINNVIQELKKATMVLGTTVTEEDRSMEQ